MNCMRRMMCRGKIKSRSRSSLSGKVDVNEEYNQVFRSKSYLEFSSKVEEQVMRRLSIERNSSFYVHLSECILEPSQEIALNTVKSSTHYNILMEYCNSSLDVCNLCEVILRSIHKTRSQYKSIQRAISIANSNFQKATIANELASFTNQSNPLSITSSKRFSDIHSRLSSLLSKLTSKHKDISRKTKPMRFFKKILGYGLAASYSVLAIALLVLAVHSIVGLIGIPGMLMVCPLGFIWKRVRRGRAILKSSVEKKVCGQLDLAARGVYTMINQLNTMDRLVVRLDNEVEHKKAIAGLCVRSYKRSQQVPKEALRELEMCEIGFLEQLDELEKHVYVCVLGINRSRRLVIEGTMTSQGPVLVT